MQKVFIFLFFDSQFVEHKTISTILKKQQPYFAFRTRLAHIAIPLLYSTAIHYIQDDLVSTSLRYSNLYAVFFLSFAKAREAILLKLMRVLRRTKFLHEGRILSLCSLCHLEADGDSHFVSHNFLKNGDFLNFNLHQIFDLSITYMQMSLNNHFHLSSKS